MLKSFTLKNGIKVATYSIPEMRSVFVSLMVKAGSIFETKKNSGVAHLMEHMLVQGIPSLPNVEVFSDYIEGLAGGYNAATAMQSIRFIINAPARHLEDVLRISSEVMFEPLFEDNAIERERRAVLEEIKERQDSLWYKNNQFFTVTRYKKGHPMLLDGGGLLESVSILTRQDLINYWESFFYPSNTHLVIVGGFDNNKVEKLVEQFFTKVKNSQIFPGFPNYTNNDLSNKKVAIRHDPKLQICYLDLCFPSISDNASLKERTQQTIIRNILGGLRRSRLYRLLRQRKGLVYSVNFSLAVYQNFGYADISCQVSKENLEEVVDLIAKELIAFIKNGPLEEEIIFAKNHHINQCLMSWDHPSAVADWIGGDLLWEKKIYLPEEYVKIIEEVDVQSIIEFMKKNWDFQKLNLMIQGPVENTKANIQKFESLISDIK